MVYNIPLTRGKDSFNKGYTYL